MARKHKFNYRKFYEQHHGPIGKDAAGRSLEVHHINGNHEDNRIENLTVVTIQEHYDIHYSQGDYGACRLMKIQRMDRTPEEISDLSRKNVTKTNTRRLADGTHNFCDGEAARQRNIKRVNAGTHNLLSDDNPSTVLAKAGKHHFQLNNPVQKLLATGAHASKIKLSCRFCKKTTSKNQFNKLHSKCE